MRFWKEFILPASLLAGTIIGAGIFSLPYVFTRAGVGLGFVLLAVFTAVYVVIHLMYGDLVLAKGDEHRFAGFARIYFGKFGYWLSILMTVVEMFFVLTIYLLLSASFISLFAPHIPALYQVIIFWWVGSLIVFSGTKRVALFDFIAVAGILAAVAIIIWLGLPGFFGKSFITVSSSPALWLLPFGPLLFSLSGRPAIPSLTHYFKKDGLSGSEAKRPIIWGTVISAVVYAVFVAGVLGISGTVSTDSISGVVKVLPSIYIAIILGALGIFSLISSYFSIGLDVFSSLKFDLKFSKNFSVFLVITLPLLVYFLNLGSFTTLVGIAGGLFVGLEGIMIVRMWEKEMTSEKWKEPSFAEATEDKENRMIKKMPKFVIYLLYAVFGISIAYVLASEILRVL